MVSFGEELKIRYPHLYGVEQTGVSTVEQMPENPQVPEGIRQLADGVQKFMPMIEQVTG